MNNGDEKRQGQVVYTNKARCRDCYRCVRVCPVKAIRMQHGQAYVEADRCIACGTCIRECPQGAKAFRNDVDEARRLVASGVTVAVSVAPSFAALWNDWKRHRLPSALRQLGFRHVGETAVGAYFVAHETARVAEADRSHAHVCTACPAVVSYVEQYDPELVETLAPVVSPMIAHAKHLKEQHGPDCRVVFVGPCVAKKAEAARPEYAGVVDCVLTFRELIEWMESAGIDLAQCEESDFDEAPPGAARYFPVPGGLLKTAALQTDLLDDECLAICGVEELTQSLDNIRRGDSVRLLEPLFCLQGCVSGPGMPQERNAYADRGRVLEYAKETPLAEQARREATPDSLSTTFSARRPHERALREDEILAELARTGKAKPEDQLNCGACGYATCRDKAVANLLGMAEPEMCVPYMRRLAEQRSDRIIDTSPNGIVILDEHLRIISMNPAFERMFLCSKAVYGKPISYLIDPAPFEKIASGRQDQIEMTTRYDSYNLACHVRLYPLREEKQFVGIFVNVTKSQADEEQLRRLRSDTISQAHELLEHQITMAQRMAQFLGENTARGEALVKNLMELAKGK